MAVTTAMPLQQWHGLIAHYFERAHFPASSCSCKQFFFLAYASAVWFCDHDRNRIKTWKWCWNSCCLLLHGAWFTKRTSWRQSEPLTLMSILCMHITVSEYIVVNLYHNICNTQTWIIQERWLSLADADNLLPLHALYFENSPVENTGRGTLK